MAITSASYQQTDYWKLPSYRGYSVKEMRELLNQRQYYAGSAKDKGKLSECLRRSDLGLISYVNLSNKDLRQLIEDRDIDTSDVLDGIRMGRRQDLVSLLESADDRPRFRKFLRLPPELRNRIYDFYFAEFEDKPIYAPTQPPLTTSCRTIRSETLQMFYSKCKFAVVFHVPVRWGIRQASLLSVPSQLLLFLRTTPAKNIALIRKLQFRLYKSDQSHGMASRELNPLVNRVLFDVVVETRSEGRQAVTLDTSNMADWPGSNRQRMKIEQEVSKVVAKIRRRDSKKSVTVDDILSFRKAIESGYFRKGGVS